MDINSLDEALFGETSWDGTLELGATLAEGKHQILIRVVAPDPDYSGILEDWWVDVVD